MTIKRSRNGIIFGVCRGIGESLGIGSTLIRITAIMLFFATGFFPSILIYLLLAAAMELE